MPTVGVLRGGPSREHEMSLKSGAAMLAALDPARYRARDIYIDTAGQWHVEGRPIQPERILRQIDVALLPLHGEYGEGGEVQQLLERFGVRYVGSNAFATNQARHKAIGKTLAVQAGLLTPEFRLITVTDDVRAAAHDIIRSFHQPVIMRPISQSSTVGVTVVGGHAPLLSAVRDCFTQGAEGVLVEELVRGHGAVVHVVEGLRGETLYAFPAVDIIPAAGNAYPYDAARRGEVRMECPGYFSRVQVEELACAARRMHQTLGLRHYSRSDFIVSSAGTYYLETASLPTPAPTDAFMLATSAVGLPTHELLEHLLQRAVA